MYEIHRITYVTPELSQFGPVMDSKVYLTSDFRAYPRDVAFVCSYKCNSNGKIDIVKGITKVRVSNKFSEGLKI
ncbi:MAG: hypothetical protein H7281_00465 [Bacteriovorax sp.]|nr:hypothetical protein [Bacteriovorax sp.]